MDCLLPNSTARLATFTMLFPLFLSCCITQIHSNSDVDVTEHNLQIHGVGVGVGVGVGEVGLQQVGGRYQREFDYFQLALQWAPTFCRKNRHCCSSNPCCQRSNSITEFTIHGLWPDYNDGTWPSCCGGHKFNQKEISTLLGGLKKYWPSLSCGSISTCNGGKGPFWAHEWEKHGTCSSSVTGDEYNYFLTTLNVYFKYNVTKVLSEEGYVPSNSEKYPLGGIISAIQNAFHVTPEVMCSGDAIQELHLCFYKDFKPRDCNTKARTGSYSSKSSCPKYVSLPAQVYSGGFASS